VILIPLDFLAGHAEERISTIEPMVGISPVVVDLLLLAIRHVAPVQSLPTHLPSKHSSRGFFRHKA
jgi:hypothetical protein